MANNTISQNIIDVNPPSDAEVVCLGVRRKYGQCGQSTILKKDKLIFVSLTKGAWTALNDIDLDVVSQFRWHTSGDEKLGTKFYALSKCGKGQPIKRMHRVIMDAPSHLFVDHINGNGLDNRRSNLRLCTHAENLRNRSKTKDNTTGFKGVSMKPNGTYCAEIMTNYKKTYIGTFPTAEEASAAYHRVSLELHGEFARP